MKTAMIINVFHSNIKNYVLQICIENQSRAARAVLINRASVGTNRPLSIIRATFNRDSPRNSINLITFSANNINSPWQAIDNI